MRRRGPDEPKIYWLPNLMTAGNLCCGFFAVLTIFKGISMASANKPYDVLVARSFYETAILLIFAACVFDLLDGRLARLGGKESEFGREFDSLADIISFGMAPAMLMAKAVLFPLDEIVPGLGWVLACIYVLCGALRLARFNCLAIAAEKSNVAPDPDFRGIPIPMAAGFIASLTFLLINLYENDRELGGWIYVLAGAMLGISMLMISDVNYPSFKKIGWRSRASIRSVALGSIGLVVVVRYYQTAPAVLFTFYLAYGLIRPLLSKTWRKSIESAIDEDEEASNGGEAGEEEEKF